MAPTPNIYTDTTVSCRAALTFFGLGRIAPEEEHTAARAGVTVLPCLETLVVNGEVFLSTDNLARTPSAEAAMLTMFGYSLLFLLVYFFDAATMRKSSDGASPNSAAQRHHWLITCS